MRSLLRQMEEAYWSATGKWDHAERRKFLRKLQRTKDRGKKESLWREADLTQGASEDLVQEMILGLEPGPYHLHLRDRAAPNISTVINDLYGWKPMLHVSEPMLRGLSVLHPDKIRVSFTLGLDSIEIL